MFFQSVLLLCLVTCVITSSDVHFDREYKKDLDDAFSLWPSIHNTARLMLSKRQAQPSDQSGTTSLLKDAKTEGKGEELNEKLVVKQASEGNTVETKTSSNDTLVPITTPKVKDPLNSTPISKPEPVKGNSAQNDKPVNPAAPAPPETIEKAANSTAPKAPSFQPDLGNPGVIKRGLIVFGGFALMATAYFIFYRRKNKNNDSNNAHGTNDNNQFRYGVLKSEDRRDNLELSRILVESDEDEDEDLEIFDLEQKKKSLSYVNLQTSDDYVVHGSRENEGDRDNLLLDIEDANSDTLINWSNNGNKSIL